MNKKKVLFVCIHNSARSQMAEAFLNRLGGDEYQAYSAGLEPGNLNPYVVKAMAEIGYDLSQNRTKSVHGFLDKSEQLNIVITVCDESAAERCPVFPGKVARDHWGFPDPSAYQGSDDEKLSFTRTIRDQIKDKVELWLSEQSKGK